MYPLVSSNSQISTINQNHVSPKYDGTEPDIAVSYYYVDEKRKVWMHTPFKQDFVVEEPYHGDDRFSIHNDHGLYMIPFLRRLSNFNKDELLVACLWLKDDKIYTDRLVNSNHEFYRCLTKDDNWILIPLFDRINYKPVRHPIMLFHAENFRKTLIFKNFMIYRKLSEMFPPYVNAFPIVIHDKMKWMIQFTDAPACYL